MRRSAFSIACVCVPAPPGVFQPVSTSLSVTVPCVYCVLPFLDPLLVLAPPPVSSQVASAKSSLYINNRQSPRQPIECAPEAQLNAGREWAEMMEGFHLEATRHRC